MQHADEAARYLKSCRSEFWQKAFAAELGYLLRHLRHGDEILSVGCGPAIIENGLASRGFVVTGLDVSPEALACATDAIKTVAGSAEEMPFPDASFDVVLYIVSLQFIENYHTALERTARVLKPGGRLIVMLLNPQSEFFKAKYADSDSYVGKVKHTDLQALKNSIAKLFETQGEYILGVEGHEVVDSSDPATAALYVVRGSKKNRQDYA